MLSKDQLQDFVGSSAYDPDGFKIGKIGAVIDDDSGEPRWIIVSTGSFGTSQSFVPVHGAGPSGGGNLIVAFPESTIKNAPQIADDRRLSVEDEKRLSRHYRLHDGGSGVRTM